MTTVAPKTPKPPKTSVTRAPFTLDGSLLHWVHPRAERAEFGQQFEWRPNDPFAAELTVDSMRSGRSAKYVILVDGDGRQFPMFVTDLLDVLATPQGVSHGSTGRQWWMVGKRGQNYGLRLVESPSRSGR